MALTVFEEPATILQAICAGADGYLLKKTSAEQLRIRSGRSRRAARPLRLVWPAVFWIWRFALPMVPIAMAVYYLAWKYVVRFLNEDVAIA